MDAWHEPGTRMEQMHLIEDCGEIVMAGECEVLSLDLILQTLVDEWNRSTSQSPIRPPIFAHCGQPNSTASISMWQMARHRSLTETRLLGGMSIT